MNPFTVLFILGAILVLGQFFERREDKNNLPPY